MATLSSPAPLGKALTVPCDHHGQHSRAWVDIEATAQVTATLRKCALEQMQLLCPAPGDVLTFESIFDEPSSTSNWTLRRGPQHVEDGETVIARASLFPPNDKHSPYTQGQLRW